MSKTCPLLWREAHFDVKMHTRHQVRTTFGSCDVEKVHAVVARSTFRSQNVQNTTLLAPLLDVEASFCVAGARDCAPCQVSKIWGFCSISKNDGRRGTFEEDLPRWIFRGSRSTRDMFIRDARRSRRWFPEWLHFGASDLQFWEDDFAWQVQHFVWPGLTFSWQAKYFRQVKWKNRKMQWYEAASSALNFPLLKEVSQNCFVFDVVNFEKWGSLADLFRFWCCQVQKSRKSRRIAAFLMLSSSKTEEVSQSRFVFKLADRQIDRQTDR